MCGEKDRAHRHLHDALGSPPRVRGKGGRGAGIRTGAGITPACAGKRSNSAAMRSRSEDHPRVCGEKNPMQMIAQFRQGSPPRVRGKAAGWRQLHTGQRITPACAGKRERVIIWQCFAWDHPRVCGEKHCGGACEWRHVGSPPRVRGKVKLLFLAVNPLRITPACAGKRERVIIWQCFAWDHPRVCGEKHCGGACEWRHVGSPPRVRGKANYEIGRNISDGITPACAGKSCRRSRRRPSSRDHPRVCGEKQESRSQPYPWIGSPPRVRGKAPCPSRR